MNPFDSAWLLLKDSITSTEYISRFPYAEEGFGPMDISFDYDYQGSSGGASLRDPHPLAQFPFNRPSSYSVLNPAVYFNHQYKDKDSLTEKDEKDIMYHTGAVGLHEATHQAVHWAEPRLQHHYREQPQAHEHAAYTAEHEADTDHPNFMAVLTALYNHPFVHQGDRGENPTTPRIKRIKEIATALRRAKDPYNQAQIMGNRARMNAKAETERLEEKNKLLAEIDRLEEGIDWDNTNFADINAIITHTRPLEDRVRELGRWYDDILQGI